MRFLYVLVAVLLSTAAFAESLSVTIFAGSDAGPGYRDGLGNAARFDAPYALAVDASGNLLVGEFSAHTIRKVSPAGAVTTVAGVAGQRANVDGRNGVARFNAPHALAVDGSGNVYVAEWNLRRISPSGAVTTLASSVPSLTGLAVDSSSNLFATDSSSDVIRKITPGGTMTTFVATADSPRGLTIDASNNLYFTADGGGVYKCTPQGVITTIATGISYPGDLDVDAAGNLYVISDQQIVKVTPGGAVTNFAGSYNQGQQDGTGSAATFLYPRDVELSPDGTLLYVADQLNDAIRKITVPGAVVTTFAGLPTQNGATEGTGLAARFYQPHDAVVAPDGNVYVADSANRRIRRITPAGVTSTLAGGTNGTADGLGTATQFGELSKIAVGYDTTNQWVLYVTDAGTPNASMNDGRVRKITQDGSVTTIATGLRYPSGVVVSASGTIYVAEFYGHTIRKIDIPSHTMTVFAGGSGMPGYVNATGISARFQHPSGLAIDAGGMLYVSDYSNNRIRRIDLATAAVTTYAGSGASGGTDGTGTSATFSAAGDLHAVGNDLYLVDSAVIRLIEPGAVVTTVAGLSGHWVNRDGTGTLAHFEALSGIGGDSNTNLYICDAYASNIRKARVAGLADAATASSSMPMPNTVVQLDTEPDTATSWTWSITRRPAGSIAELSSTAIRNPTFTPDVAELFTFLLRAEGAGGVRYSTVDVLATSCATPLASVVASTVTTEVCSTGSQGTASVTVSGGMGVQYQWGYRTAPGGAVTPIAGATLSTYSIIGAELGGTGRRYLVVLVTPSCGVPTVSNDLAVDVTAPPDATISASSGVFASSSGNFASVADAGAGATYTWSITNGTINAGQGLRTIHYSAGASGNVTLNVTVSRNGCGTPGTAIVPIQTRPAGATLLYTITPCRVVDTRNSSAIANAETRNVMLAGLCGIPVDAKAVVANITAVSPAANGWLALWPAGTPWGGTSTVNYRTGKTRSNNAIVPVANDGYVSVLNSGAAQHLIIDVTGYLR